jgi:hypothetical protein
MDIKLQTDEQILDFYKTIKYLVISPDKTISHHTSLRKIAIDIGVDFTTISKHLGEKNPCICSSKNGGYSFLIKRLSFD